MIKRNHFKGPEERYRLKKIFDLIQKVLDGYQGRKRKDRGLSLFMVYHRINELVWRMPHWFQKRNDFERLRDLIWEAPFKDEAVQEIFSLMKELDSYFGSVPTLAYRSDQRREVEQQEVSRF